MPIAGSIFLIAVGAILRYATNFHVQGVSVDTVGLILMIAGAAALVLSFAQQLFWRDRLDQRQALAEERELAARGAPPREVPPSELPPREVPPREPPRY